MIFHSKMVITMSENKTNFYTFALNPYIQTNKVDGGEKKVNNADFILWGEGNKYPNYLYELYENCATLQSVINGTADFICGDSTESRLTTVNKLGETFDDVLRKITIDYLIFGGFAVQVIRNPFGKVNEIYWVDFMKLRSDEKNEVFFYSDDWDKSLGRVKTIKYPKFGKDDENPVSIYYYKGNKTRKTYPTPVWNAAIDSAEIEKRITQFHLNEISNNFLSSKIINFNSGMPDETIKNEIERNLTEKFGGSENAGRFLVSFNENKDSETTVTSLGEDGFADRYNALAERVESQIFTAFRATPNLFGLPNKTTGFNEQEYEGSFKLYNRTAVKPIQKAIIDVFEKIYGEKGIITIQPYTIENNVEKEVE